MYLTKGEDSPQKQTGYKSHIINIIFLCDVAMPNFGDDRRFVGLMIKIGLWSFTKDEVANRTSANRETGALVQKSINMSSIIVISKLLPEIKQEMAKTIQN
jgi:hypothetical protein